MLPRALNQHHRRDRDPGSRPAVVAVVSACLLASACEEPPVREEVERAIRAVRVVDAEGLGSRSFPCRAEPIQQVNIAFEVPGRLIERPVSVGAEVAVGDLLARLDPSDFQNSLNQAEARANQTRAMRDRVAEARQTGAVSEQELTNAQADLDAAASEVEIRAKALADTQLVTPFEGMIVATYVQNFQNVQAKQPVMRVVDISSIECVINIPETLISAVPYIRDIQVRFDAFPNHQIEAAISEIGREASEITRTFPITLVMDQPDDIEILPGMAGRATGHVVLPEDPAGAGYDVPMSALFSDDGERSLVWVIDQQSGTASKREVEKLAPGPTGMRIRGVAPGEWVAITAVHFLREGQRVRLQSGGTREGGP
jgi:RND family efflux transporter MFP subunit